MKGKSEGSAYLFTYDPLSVKCMDPALPNIHEDGPQGAITILLKYSGDREPAISDIKRVSKPGLRRYVPNESIPRVLNGMGIAILSTSKGVMVDREARKQKVGGELICTVW